MKKPHILCSEKNKKVFDSQMRLAQVEFDKRLSMDEFLAILLEKYQLNKG